MKLRTCAICGVVDIPRGIDWPHWLSGCPVHLSCVENEGKEIKRHRAKCLTPYFREIISGNKTFEIRFNDRGYKEGDEITLLEFTGIELTGNEATFKIGYLTNFEQKAGHVVFSLLRISNE